MKNRSTFDNISKNKNREKSSEIVDFQELVKIKESKYKRKKRNFKREYRRKYF
jgi:hypothetical protein